MRVDPRLFLVHQPIHLCFCDMVTVKELEGQLKVSIDDMKQFFKAELDNVKADFKVQLNEQAKIIGNLKSEISTLNKRVTKLEAYVDEEDSYERRDTVILSGEAVPNFSPNESCQEVLIKVVKDNLHLEITPGDISTVHRLGRKPDSNLPDKRSIIVKLTRRDLKREFCASARKLKRPSKLFVNESLTPKRSTIYKTLRSIKKDHGDLVTGCTTMDGRVYAFTPSGSANGRDRRHLVNTYESLSQFCNEFVHRPIENFLSAWNH